jgi:ribosome-associated toxin RatA of RatAB toxin-antitoxin module
MHHHDPNIKSLIEKWEYINYSQQDCKRRLTIDFEKSEIDNEEFG